MATEDSTPWDDQGEYHPVPGSDEMFFVADRMLKCEEMQTVAARAFRFGRDTVYGLVLVTFKGDVNNTTPPEKEAVTIGMRPDMAMELIRSLRHAVQAIPMEDR